MRITLNGFIAIGIHVASIDVPEHVPATAAFKMLLDKDVNWEDISAWLTDKAKS